MPAISRTTDAHTCPVADPTPHVGGVIQGSGSVSVGYQPVARVGSACTCGGGPPNSIVSGSSSVMVDHMPAARVGSSTAHGGVVVSGDGSVVVP